MSTITAIGPDKYIEDEPAVPVTPAMVTPLVAPASHFCTRWFP